MNSFYVQSAREEIGQPEKKKLFLPESSSFSCRLFSFCVRCRVSVERWISRKACRCPRSVRYLVYMPARFTARYNSTFVVSVRTMHAASRSCERLKSFKNSKIVIRETQNIYNQIKKLSRIRIKSEVKLKDGKVKLLSRILANCSHLPTNINLSCMMEDENV